MLPQIDVAGQQKLISIADVLVLGMGGLGCPLLMYLVELWCRFNYDSRSGCC